MRIAVIGPRSPLRGGIAAHTRALEGELTRRGHEVIRIGFSRMYPPGVFPGASEHVAGAHALTEADSGSPVASIDALNPLSWSHARRVLDSSHCDRIVFQWWHPFFSRLITSLVRDADVPVIGVCHNARPHEGYPGWKRATMRALARADLLLCHSQAVSAELAHIVPQSRRRVVAMPLLLESVTTLDRGDARRRLGLRANARLALFAGHARRYKGAELLLAAWDEARLPNLSGLVLVGESYLGRGRLRKTAAACRRRASIRVIDRYVDDDDFAAWLVACDVVVLPYLRASQSGLAGTAVAAGARLIASDTGGLGEQARRFGATLVKPGSVVELAQALSIELARAPHCDAARHRGHEDAIAAASAQESLALACESAIRCE
jgi:glycosyltransferase involved in cell wall biosynthesis